MIVRPYRPGDAALLAVRPEQAAEHALFLQDGEPAPAGALTIADERGPLVVGGVHRQWTGVGTIWALWGAPSARDGRRAALLMRGVLDAEWPTYWRLDATIRPDFTIGARFLEWLGLLPEARLARYFPDGGDAELWARVREGSA